MHCCVYVDSRAQQHNKAYIPACLGNLRKIADRNLRYLYQMGYMSCWPVLCSTFMATLTALVTHLQLQSLLIHILAPAGDDKVRVLATGVTLPSHGRGIADSGNDSATNAWLACQPLDGVASLALQSDICCLVLQQMPFLLWQGCW